MHPAPVSGAGRCTADAAAIQFPPFETGRSPSAEYVQIGLARRRGARRCAISSYDRTWRLAPSLRRGATSPYDYVLRVNDYLRRTGFGYTEVPDRPGAGVAPLESFLFDSRRGYCQQFSGAMALLLRMGGIPARVATGFSPGGLRASSGEWVVRDTDAHSWVEAWFDGIGWVTFDPTPPDTPARSQIAAIGRRRRGRRRGATTAARTPATPLPAQPGRLAARPAPPRADGGAQRGGARRRLAVAVARPRRRCSPRDHRRRRARRLGRAAPATRWPSSSARCAAPAAPRRRARR